MQLSKRLQTVIAGLLLAVGIVGPAAASNIPVDSNNRPFTFPIPMTSGGLKVKSFSLTATKQAVLSAAGQLYSVTCSETGGVAAYLQLWNIASASVTVGTTAPTISEKFAANAVSTATSGILSFPGAMGVQLDTALTAAATTTRAGSSAGALDCNFYYRD